VLNKQRMALYIEHPDPVCVEVDENIPAEILKRYALEVPPHGSASGHVNFADPCIKHRENGCR
jgi:hypothetical protein